MKKLSIIGLMLIFQCHNAITQMDSIKYGLKGKIIRALCNSSSVPSECYAGLKGDKLGAGLVYKSEDFGKSWFVLNNGEPISPYVADIQAIAISNHNDNIIYAGTWKDGLYKSIDKGSSWNRITAVPSSDIRSIKTGVQTPSLIYAATSSFGVIKSADGGLTWERNDPAAIDSSFKFAWSIELDQRNDNIVYAQTFNKGVWKSIDQGNSWQQILDVGNKVCWDAKISNKSNSIWVAASKSRDSLSVIYHSMDQGETWHELDNVPQIGASQINVIERSAGDIIYIGSWSDGVYVLNNNMWTKVESVDYQQISEILINGQALLIGSWGNGLYKLDH